MRTAQQQIEHYKAVKARFRTAGPKPVVVTLIQQPDPKPVAKPPRKSGDWINPVYVYAQPVGPIQPPSIMREVPGQTEPNYLAARRILREVCFQYAVSPEEIKSDRRQLELVAARHELMGRLRFETSMTFPQIAKFCGGRDHSTAIHGSQKYALRMERAKLLGVTTAELFRREQKERNQRFFSAKIESERRRTAKAREEQQ